MLSGYFLYEFNVSVTVQAVCFILYPFPSQSLVQAVCFFGSANSMYKKQAACKKHKQPVRDIRARLSLKTHNYF